MYFVGTGNDLEPGIRAIEAEVPLHYVATGFHINPTPERFLSALDIPEFGKLISLYYQDGPRKVLPGDYMSSQSYLVSPVDVDFEVRPIPQIGGGIMYKVEATRNPGAFGFAPGGIDDRGWLFGGYCSKWPTMHLRAKELSKRFFTELTKGFSSAQGWKRTGGKDRYKVGPDASQMLRSGLLRTIESEDFIVPEK